MKERKASKAMGHIEDELILSAMDSSDTKGKPAKILGGKNMKNTIIKKWIPIAAAFVLILSAVLITGIVGFGGSDAIIAFDVNPSIEIEINKHEEVKEIRALNDEAREVIGEMDLEGVDLDVAVNAIIGSMVKKGYISTEQNSILVSIDTKSGRQSDKLREKLAGEINTLLEGSNISASVITQSFDKNGSESQKAEKNKISTAKAALIGKIINAGLLDANGVPYTYERLAQLKVNDLKLILESKSVKVDGIASSGEASTGRYISAEEVLAIALAEAGVEKTDVTRLRYELDYDDDKNVMVYEVEFVLGDMEYEYEIIAENGSVIEKEVKPFEKDDDENISSPENAISREQALSIAYADAGAEEAKVRRPEIELDMERGSYVYEIEFKYQGNEYEYTVHAISGEILEREVEPIDD